MPQTTTTATAPSTPTGQRLDLNEITAAQRGAAWMLRWNCTPWCINDHTAPAAPEWHSKAPVETELRDSDIDSSGYGRNGTNLPWLAAEIIVANDQPQAYGRETEVWLSYGIHTAQLTPARAREALTAMRGFITQLEAVCDQADQIAADDFKGDPEIARLDREADDRRIQRINKAGA